MIFPEDISIRFNYHAPTPEKVDAHQSIRSRLEDAAHYINARVPDGREKSLAITALEEAMMWANAGIARNP